jgi:hypothetical protein
MILLSVMTALHYADKATSYIFTAEALIFMAILFIVQVIKPKWKSEYLKTVFLLLAVITVLSLTAVFAFSLDSSGPAVNTTATTGEAQAAADGASRLPSILGVSLALVALVAALVVLALGAGFPLIRSLRSFDLVILQLTLILPLLSAAIIKVIGFDPLDYTQEGMIRSAMVIIPTALISLLGGLLWDRKVWVKCAVIFWSIFIVFYTTFFTQGDGFFVGLMGALGYWMSQQSVQRGTQPPLLLCTGPNPHIRVPPSDRDCHRPGHRYQQEFVRQQTR